MEYAIYVDTGGYYRLTNNDFEATTQYFNPAVSTMTDLSFVYVEDIPWVSGQRYTITSKATDKAGNVQDSYTVTVNSVSFVYDITPPAVGVIEPNGLREVNVPALTGNRRRPAGLGQPALKRSPGQNPTGFAFRERQ